MAKTILTGLDPYEPDYDPSMDDPDYYYPTPEDLNPDEKAVRLPAPGYNAVVAKSNKIIEALAKFDLSELRLLSFCIAHYDSRPPALESQKGRRVIARVNDLKKIFAMSTNAAYSVVKEKIKSINKNPYEYIDPKTGEEVCEFWFTSFRYSPKKGEFSFGITPEMEPHLLGLAGNFTRWRLGNVYRFKSANTWKLYENIAQHLPNGRWHIKNLDNLRLRLGVAGKYTEWKILNQKLIAPAVKEINAVSDLCVEYSQEKSGRRVTGLVFQIDKKVDPDIINQAPPEDELEKLLLTHGINAKTAQNYARIIKDSGKADAIIAKMPKITARAQKSNTPTAKYILGAIKQELRQMSLFEIPKQDKPDHTEALDCWNAKRQKKKVCPVRTKGKAGQRKKCQTCLEKIPIETFGV